MVAGVNILATPLKCNIMGPKGRNVVLDKSFGAPTITKDGVSACKEIRQNRSSKTWAPRWSGSWDNRWSRWRYDDSDRTGQSILEQKGWRRLQRVWTRWMKRGIDKAVAAAVAEVKAVSSSLCRQQSLSLRSERSLTATSALVAWSPRRWKKVGQEGVITVEEGSGLGRSTGCRRKAYALTVVICRLTSSTARKAWVLNWRIRSSCWLTRKFPTSAKCCRCWKRLPSLPSRCWWSLKIWKAKRWPHWL